MPMNWTPENDRLLLLKLIQTQCPNVNYELIAENWPKDAPNKPSGRAISERFVKLRKLAGTQAPVRSAANTPSRPRARQPKSTPKSSAKKRKVTRDNSESDADDYFTGDETPTKPTFAQRSDVRGRGRGEGATNDAVRVKKENPDMYFDPLDFAQASASATQLRAAAEDPFDALFPGSTGDLGQMQAYHGSNGASNGNGHNNFGTAVGMGALSDTYGSVVNMPIQDPLAAPASHISLSVQPGTKFNGNGNVRATAQSARPYKTPSDASIGRARTIRMASQHASDAWKRDQAGEDGECGDKASEEDSQGSQYEESDGDFI